ncbi:unnamed protein product [Spodoptera exigua]|nr:unnamed protein product [Spodoptera exigua]
MKTSVSCPLSPLEWLGGRRRAADLTLSAREEGRSDDGFTPRRSMSMTKVTQHMTADRFRNRTRTQSFVQRSNSADELGYNSNPSSQCGH